MAENEERKKYQRPSLQVFGSVRNLTGGSGTMGRDGNGTMTMN